MKKPVLCIVSEIPKMASLITEKCSSLLSKINVLDPSDPATSSSPLLKEAEIIISEPHFANLWLNGVPNLRMVQGTWAGVDSMMDLVSKEDKLPEFTYCRFGSGFEQPMAEYVLAYIVAEERNFSMTYKAQRESRWSDEMKEYIWYHTRSLKDLSIGILGLGSIGRKVAQACKAFGMGVQGLVTSVPTDDEKCPFVDEYKTGESIDDILSSCDYICSILPSTPQTRGLLDHDRFRACRTKQAVFINVGRGDVCTEHSVLKALDQGWLRAAVLDVFPTEPLPSDSPLWQHPKVTITPHIAAVSIPEQLIDKVAENINNYVCDRPLSCAIDWRKGY